MLLLLGLLVALPALAAIDVYEFDSAEDTRRFNDLIGSDAPISADLRRRVAGMIQDGYSDAEIRDFLHDRYGDFILYRPRLTLGTALLWFGPAVLLLIGIGVAVRMARRGPADDGGELSIAEREALERLRRDAAEPPATGRS